MKLNKGLAKGIAKISLIVLVLAAFGIFVLNFVLSAIADTHTSHANVTPIIVKGGSNYEFTVVVYNDGGDPISEFRIYNNTDPDPFTNLVCYPADGWNGPFYIPGTPADFCQYTAKNTSMYIYSGNFKVFKFSADAPTTDCWRTIMLETRDPNQYYTPLPIQIAVDAQKPITTKSFIGPYKIDENGVEWIDGVTLVNLTAVDPEPHPSGVNKIFYKNIVFEGDDPCLSQSECEELRFLSGQYPGDFIEYTEPFSKQEESCHVLWYYSVDNVGNVEDVKVNCFFVDKTPPEVTKVVNQPKVEKLDLERLGNGKADWVTSQNYSGSSSAKLVIPDNAVGTDFAGVDSFFDVFVELDDITSLSYYRKVVKFDNGWSPLVILGIDADGDGKFEAKPLEWEASLSAGSVNSTLLGDDSFIQCEAEVGLSTPDSDWVYVDAYNNFKCYTPNVTGNGYEAVYDYLEYFQENSVGRIEPTDKVAMVKIELGGNPPTQENEIAYVDYVEMNDDIIIDEPDGLTWVSYDSDIVFTCVDQGPHPSGGEEICYKVSYDSSEGWEYITDEYCSHSLNVDGYCCEQATASKPFTFNFKEETKHNLEYYCKDAVEKKSDVYIQFYKVDNTPPSITKTMIGEDHLGQCPPGPNPTEPCYVKDDGENGVHIDVTDGGEICVVNDVTCTYELWWQTDLQTCIDEFEGTHLYNPDTGLCFVEGGEFGEEGKDVIFYQDSTHILKVNCKDALGNEMVEDVETFLVDSTPPVTNKTYGQPFYTDGYADWITSQTPINLTANDAKVGVKGIYWKYKWTSNNLCNATLTPRSGTYYWYPVDNCPKYLGNPYPSTNEWNKNGNNPYHSGQIGPHVNLISTGVGQVTLEFVNPYDYWVCFEYRSDGDIGQYINHSHYSPCIDDDLYPYVCLKKSVTGETKIMTINATQYVEVRSMFGAERDWDFGWTRFDVILDTEEWNYENDNSVTFTIPEDSCHKIEYFAVDNLNNIEEIKRQFVNVDNTKPKTWVEVGEPKIPCDPEDPTGCDYWIRDHVTPIDIYCEDQGDHPVDNSHLYYRYKVDDGAWTNWTDPNGYEAHKQIIFKEDSVHYLQYYCVDALGNSDGTAQQPYEKVYKVDSTPPTVTKTVGEPKIQCIEENCDWWITQDTEITLTAVDGGEICAVGGVKCYYRYGVDSQPGTETFFDDVESGADDWTATGLWHITEYRSHSSTHSWAYNKESDHNYDTGSANSGELISKNISLGFNNPQLTFWSWEQTECGGYCNYDIREVYVNDGSGWVKVWYSTGPENQWHQVTINLSAYEGKTVKIKFRFDTIDALFNNYEGWYVDDIQVTNVENWTEYTGPFKFKEDSVHYLQYYCVDALGNKGQIQTEIDKVDSTPPTTRKEYGKPFYTDKTHDWITSQTPITLTAEDGGETCHVGWNFTKYRYCLYQGCYESEEPCSCPETPWSDYTGSFTIPEDSEHCIEFYSEDKLGNKEKTKSQCVYVDNKAPVPLKEVGEPKEKWNGADAEFYPDIKDMCWSTDPTKNISCWKITRFTPISLDCVDQDPHPVDHEKVCFKVGVDAKDKTEEYCEEYNGEFNVSGDGFCCVNSILPEFFFLENTEHELEYYCVDALGNKGTEIDVEKFKVEGTDFEIPLYEKWNLISVPFVLLDNRIENVFDGVEANISSVWKYDNVEKKWYVWSPGKAPDSFNTIDPGWGYWVVSKDGTCKNPVMLKIAGSLFSGPGTTPPNRVLTSGWNLIGYYGTHWQWYDVWEPWNYICGQPFGYKWVYGGNAYCSLGSLASQMKDLPSYMFLTVEGYVNCGDHKGAFYPVSICSNPEDETIFSRMYAGRGYWIHLPLSEDGEEINYLYAPFTSPACPWDEDIQCTGEFP